MTVETPAKKRRRRKRRPSGGQAGPAPSQNMEAIVAAAVQAALAGLGAVPNLIPAKQVEDRPGIMPEDADGYDDSTADAEIAAVEKQHEARLMTAEELTTQLLPLIMQKRHLDVIEWLATARECSIAQCVVQILRAEVSRELPNYREAHGAGGASTKSAATMAKIKGE